MRIRAFTLLEMMVAMAVASLLLTLLAAALQGVTETTGSTAGRIEAEREARAAFEFLERDLESAVTRGDGREWIRVVDDPAMPGSQWLLFLSVPLDHTPAEAGDLCLLSYRAAAAPPPGGTRAIPAIHRLRMAPGNTFADVLDEDTLDGAAIDAPSRDYENWLASGVIGLRIHAWTGGAAVELGDPAAAPAPATWEALEVTLELLTKRGQVLYGELPAAELRQKFGHRFTRRIPLPLSSP